jgi:predicted NUDIX family phosphoesterase
MFREINEEVELQSKYVESCIGLINDDSTPVGKVHLGIVHLLLLEEPRVLPREKALIRAGFSSIDELKSKRHEFETWSQYVLDALAVKMDESR